VMMNPIYSLNDKTSVSVTFNNHGKTFNVEVKAWKLTPTKWAWNVYVHIFDGHRLFESNEAILDLPLHGGVTFDESSSSECLNGDLRRLCKTVGCHYMHMRLQDDYENCSPLDGIPQEIEMEAQGLFRKLERSE